MASPRRPIAGLPTALQARWKRIRLRTSLFWLILLPTIVAGFFPLAFLSYVALNVHRVSGERATAMATRQLDEKGIENLQLQTNQTADAIARFLYDRVADARAATILPRTDTAYLAFYRAQQGTLWYPAGPGDTAGKRETVPLYREMAYIDASGREVIRIENGQLVPAERLRDVSLPANTTYKTEDYFAQTRRLAPGEVYVSRVMAWHISNPLQPASQGARPGDPAWGERYARYEAVIRIGVPVFTSSGAFDGMVLLSLDHRHIMEFVVHILPAMAGTQTVWPDYASGNYGQMWDDEGYLIAHPVLARLRGLDANGQLLPSFTPDTPRDQVDRLNANMQLVNRDAPFMYAAVRNGERSYRDNRNAAGVLKTNTFAPVPFNLGVYQSANQLGGFMLSNEVEAFHKGANELRAAIQEMQQTLLFFLITLILLGLAALFCAALLVARGVTAPVLKLTAVARRMEQGELDTVTLNELLDRNVDDEVMELTRVFKHMGEQVQLRERRLKEQIDELSIQIDEQKRKQHVREITETDYFQTLAASARLMRNRMKEPRPASP